MKVRVSFTVDIDPESWQMNYGTDPSLVREDAKEYIENLVREHLHELALDKR